MPSHVLINIFEYRIGEPPQGSWRFVYDRYPSGKPVEEASEDQGRAAFSAYRAQAEGTVPIYRHRYVYDEPMECRSILVPENEKTPASYECSEDSSANDDVAPYPQWANGMGVPMSTAPRRWDHSMRAFWAFPVSSGGDAPGSVPVFEHRLEIDVSLRGPGGVGSRLVGRYAAYIKYSTDENAGRVFHQDPEAVELSGPSAEWWRQTSNDVSESSIYARYTRKIAFYAFPAR
jgi:hypothetical protein